MSKIKITPLGGVSYHVELDGIDISNYVRRVEYYHQAGEKPLVHLLLIPMDVELPEPLEAVVDASRGAELLEE